MNNSPAIQIEGLKKSYGKTVALTGVDLTIPQGSFYGLLGPNGAGKSTTINILTGLVIRDSGKTNVFGRDTVKDYRFTRAQIGLAAQELPIDWFFPIERLLYFHAGYYGISKAKAKPRIEELLVKLGLEKKRKARLRQLSGGMKRSFQIAKALVHDPPLIILDEPTAGVDVELRHELWQYLKDLHGQGKTILLTTHYIEEAELLCERTAIIDQGKVIADGTPAELTKAQGKSGITLKISNWDDSMAPLLDGYTYTYDSGSLHLIVKEPDDELPVIITRLCNGSAHITNAKITKTTLEDVFLNLTGRGITE